MSLLTRNPQTQDLMQSTKFKLNFERLPGMTFFCQSVNLPGVSLGEVLKPTPFVDLYAPGDKIIYDTFNATFLVDEKLQSWKEIHDWIRGLTYPTDFSEYRNLQRLSSPALGNYNNKKFQYSNAIVSVYTNKNNPNIRLSFRDVFPTSVGTIIFNTQDTAENIISCDATFRFAYYDIEILD